MHLKWWKAPFLKNETQTEGKTKKRKNKNQKPPGN